MKGWDWLALLVVIIMLFLAIGLINHTADAVINYYR